jgi:hypothetical protein
MTQAKKESTIVAITEVKLQRVSDGLIYHLPTPANMVVDLGKDERVIMGKDRLGKTVKTSSYVRGESPTVTLSYQHVQPELLQFRIGNYFENQTKELYIPISFNLSEGGTFPASQAPNLGHAIIAGADAIASIKKANGMSQALQEGVDFTIGAGGAITFSAALVAAKETVSMLIPYSVTGVGIGAQLIGQHRIVASAVDTEGYVWIFYAPNSKPSTAGGTIDFSAEGFDLTLEIYPSGGCQSYTLMKTGDRVSC